MLVLYGSVLGGIGMLQVFKLPGQNVPKLASAHSLVKNCNGLDQKQQSYDTKV